jgi:hypothetical protein
LKPDFAARGGCNNPVCCSGAALHATALRKLERGACTVAVLSEQPLLVAYYVVILYVYGTSVYKQTMAASFTEEERMIMFCWLYAPA